MEKGGEELYVIFESRKDRLGKLMNHKKKYSLLEADDQLRRFSETLSKSTKKNTFIIKMYDNDEMIFRSEFVVGTDESSNLIVLLMYLLETEFSEENEEDKSELLQRVNEAYLAEEQATYQRDKDYIPGISVIEKFTDTQTEISNEKIFIEESMIQEANHHKNKKHLSLKKERPAIDFAGLFQKYKKILILIVAFFVMGTGSTLFFKNSLEANQKESYSELVDHGKYNQALQDYPEKETNLIETLYSQKKSKELKELADTKHSKLALFYWSFLNKKWESVTEINGISQDTTIQAMKGYAYLAQGKLEEAELINEVLKNSTLEEQIDQFKKQLAYEKLRNQDITSAENINKEINDSDLKEDIEVAKSIINLLKKYKADQENTQLSEDERKEAKKNYEIWSENLKQLGGTINDAKNNE